MKRGALHDPNDHRLAFATSLETVVEYLPPGETPDWFAGCPPDGNALLNDDLSCCCEAADWRIVQLWRAAAGEAWSVPPDLVRLRYQAVAGYDGTPATDLGTIPAADCFNWMVTPLVDNDGREWPATWVTVPDYLLPDAIRRGPLLVTIGLLIGEDDPNEWAEMLEGAPVEFHRVVAGAVDDCYFMCRTWGLDVPVHRSRIIAADLMVPRANHINADLRMAGIDFGRLTRIT